MFPVFAVEEVNKSTRQARRISHTARTLHKKSREAMRKPICSMFVSGLWAAASVMAVSAHGPLAFKARAWDIASKGEEDCHRSFPAFLWAGSNTGDQLQVRQ